MRDHRGYGTPSHRNPPKSWNLNLRANDDGHGDDDARGRRGYGHREKPSTTVSVIAKT